MSSQDHASQLIARALQTLNDSLPEESRISGDPDTPLYGARGGIDSLTLVNLIVNLEEAIEGELGLSLPLADDRTMSPRSSPFRTIATLRDHLEALLDHARCCP